MAYWTLSTARSKFGRLLDRVLKKGELIIIRHLKQFAETGVCIKEEPIPLRPAGYFVVRETLAEYERANCLSMLGPDKPE